MNIKMTKCSVSVNGSSKGTCNEHSDGDVVDYIVERPVLFKLCASDGEKFSSVEYEYW